MIVERQRANFQVYDIENENRPLNPDPAQVEEIKKPIDFDRDEQLIINDAQFLDWIKKTHPEFFLIEK